VSKVLPVECTLAQTVSADSQLQYGAKRRKAFTWRVAAPHFAPDGVTVNKGFYKAVIPTADAALLWGMTNPNDAASALEVSLTTEAGGTAAFLKSISVKNGKNHHRCIWL
jgi:hypothetical protein